MDLNSALREEFDALKKSSAAHSIPHAQLQAAWARTMERALESLERKDEAIERYREKEEELERKIETLSEEVGRWKEAMAEVGGRAHVGGEEVSRNPRRHGVCERVISGIQMAVREGEGEVARESKNKLSRRGTFAVVERHFRREKAGFVAQVTPNGRAGEGWVHRRDSQGFGQ